MSARVERALERGVDRDRLHDVGDDQDFQSEQDRPADVAASRSYATSVAPRGRPRGADEGHERTDGEDRHAGDSRTP